MPLPLALLSGLLPKLNLGDRAEQMRACAGALFGLVVTGLASTLLVGHPPGAIYLIAPMGASAVLLFGVPASPLAQPWSIMGGNLVAAFVGVTCARLVDDVILAAALAGCLAIAAMFALRCLHPPSGAVALTAVLGGPAVHAAGYGFLLLPVGLNSLLLLCTALFYNNVTGRRYPHLQQPLFPNIHDTVDEVPTARLGFTPADLDAVLARYDQVLDVSRDDLEAILLETEMQAHRRRFGTITCGEIMSKDVVTLVFATELDEAWRLMHHHRVTALPVLNSARRVIGIVTQDDFLKHSALDTTKTLAAALRRLIERTRHTHSSKPEVVGQIMASPVYTVQDSTPMVELVPLMADAGLHHFPVIDDDRRFVGIVTQSDLVAALYEQQLAA